MATRPVEWVGALGAWIGAGVTAIAVVVSALSITQQLAATERQQQLARMESARDAFQEAESKSDAARCARNAYQLLSAEECQRLVFENAFAVDEAMTSVIRYLAYLNLVYQYDAEFCPSHATEANYCISTYHSLDVIRTDHLGLFARAVRMYPSYNYYWDVDRQSGSQILSDQDVEDGNARFTSFAAGLNIHAATPEAAGTTSTPNRPTVLNPMTMTTP